MSAPLPTFDSAGNASWTNPSTPPTSWLVECVYQDGTFAGYADATNMIAGGLTSFQAHTAGWPGGYCLKLSGVDSHQNLIIAPTVSTTFTKNQ